MSIKNPKWSRDELILALELYFEFEDKLPDALNEKVIGLSRELTRLTENVNSSPTFRNANSVSMKLANFSRLDPKYLQTGKKGLTRGGKTEAEVWNEFSQKLYQLKKTASAIRESLFIFNPQGIEKLDTDFVEAIEGGFLSKIHLVRERSAKISKQKKAAVLSVKGKLECEGCGFDFEKVYGIRGQGYIECHHTLPLSEYSGQKTTKLEHLALVCANCHRMIHSKKEWLTMDQLKSLVSKV